MYNNIYLFVGKISSRAFQGDCREKAKKLLTLIIAVAVVVVVVVVLASVFAVRQVLPVYHNFEGGQTLSVEGAPTANDVLQLAKGKSIFTLSKSQLTDKLNSQYPEWSVVGIVKNFPNILEVHFVQRGGGGESQRQRCPMFFLTTPVTSWMPRNRAMCQ